MIQIQDVSFEYEKEQGTLSHIDLNIQQGECVVLTGESGCGKTTVTKLINGLIPHFVEGGTLSGTTIVNGMEVPKTEMYRLAEQVGSVFQNPKSQFFNIDSDSEITFGLENAGVEPKKIKERYEATISALKIQSLLGRNIFSMSGGEKQSLAFASVYALFSLVLSPQLFLLSALFFRRWLYRVSASIAKEPLRQPIMRWKICPVQRLNTSGAFPL